MIGHWSGSIVQKIVAANRENDLSARLAESQRASRPLPPKVVQEIELPPIKKPAAVATKKAPLPAKAVAAPKKAAAPVKAAPATKNAPPAKKAPALAKKAVAAKAVPQITVTLKQIAAELAESHDLPKKVAEGMLGDFVTLATQHLQKGNKIRLSGLGILQVRSREARTGRNPGTGESIEIAASKKIAFRPAKELKEAV
jgi:DNA-binding protein HU-beta